MTVIKLDLDDITYKTLLSRITYIKKYSWAKEIQVYESCRMSGYHIYIKSFWKIKQSAIYHIRYELNDDVKRLVRDMLGLGEDLLFSHKLENKRDEQGNITSKHLWSRTIMLKYYRKTNQSSWEIKKFKRELLH